MVEAASANLVVVASFYAFVAAFDFVADSVVVASVFDSVAAVLVPAGAGATAAAHGAVLRHPVGEEFPLFPTASF